MKNRHSNRGFKYERTQHDPVEKAFADAWEAANKKSPGLNYGQGLLQDLFFDGNSVYRAECVHVIKPKERWVVATVMQWLGTNCGFSYLRETLRRAGFAIIRIEELNPEQKLKAQVVSGPSERPFDFRNEGE